MDVLISTALWQFVFFRYLAQIFIER